MPSFAFRAISLVLVLRTLRKRRCRCPAHDGVFGSRRPSRAAANEAMYARDRFRLVYPTAKPRGTFPTVKARHGAAERDLKDFNVDKLLDLNQTAGASL
jgi:hypothetical protein